MWKTKTTAQSTSDFSPKYQTSEISLKTSDLMLKHQNWRHCLSTSLRNQSCKRLGSRPNRSITLSTKPCLSLLIFSRGMLIVKATNFLTQKLKILTLYFTNFDFILTYKFPAFGIKMRNTKHILQNKPMG